MSLHLPFAKTEISPAELVIFAIFLVLFIWSLVWVNRDAEARGKNGCLVMALVFLLSWPISLLVWIVFRPEKRSSSNDWSRRNR